jgi:hypothetical protein
MLNKKCDYSINGGIQRVLLDRINHWCIINIDIHEHSSNVFCQKGI